MSRKDIPDEMVVRAYIESRESIPKRFPYDFLMEWTGQPLKVCHAAMERACQRGFIEYGVCLRSGWVEPAGLELIGERAPAQRTSLFQPRTPN